MYIIYYRTGPRDGSKPYTRNRVEETLVSYPQQTMLNKFKQSWPKMAFVCVLGIVVSYVIGRGREQTAFVWIINAIFSAGMALLLVGIAHQLTNMHMFTSLSYGVKLLKMIFRNEHKSADDLKDDYIEYSTTGVPKYSGVYFRRADIAKYKFTKSSIPYEIWEGTLSICKDEEFKIIPLGPQKIIYKNGEFFL